MTSELKTLKTTNTKLKEDNALFRDDIIDLKCRSTRDNLLFIGIPEGAATYMNGPTPIPELTHPQQLAADTIPEGTDGTDPLPAGATSNATQSNQSAERGAFTQDDCVKKVHFFCENVLQVENTIPVSMCVSIELIGFVLFLEGKLVYLWLSLLIQILSC